MKCSQEQFLKCQNNNLCHLCDGTRLYKPPKTFTKSLHKKKKEGMDFEKRVAKQYNNKINQDNSTRDIAKRRPNSGAFWSMPGDIVTRDALFEAKERGTKTARGEKTISIHKDWLDKVHDEAINAASKQYWFLPFGFKNDKKIYVVTDFDIELQLIDTIHQQEKIIIELRQSIKDSKEVDTDDND